MPPTLPDNACQTTFIYQPAMPQQLRVNNPGNCFPPSNPGNTMYPTYTTTYNMCLPPPNAPLQAAVPTSYFQPQPPQLAGWTTAPAFIQNGAAMSAPTIPQGGSSVYIPICPPAAMSPGHSSPSLSPSLAQFADQSSMTSQQMCLSAAPVNPLLNSTNMEVVWHSTFNQLFAAFSTRWQLLPGVVSPTERCQVFNDSAKVRFLCKSCGNAWTSMKGRVVFYIKFENDVGTVRFTLFGQKCQKCMPETFEHAMWYPEEVVKVVGNVFNHVGQLYYGFQQTMISTVRRTGRPRTQHNSQLCQACAMGICREKPTTNHA